MSQLYWHIENCSLFKQLASSQLAQLERHARLRQFPRQSVIYLPTDTADQACLLVEGRIRICSNTLDGKQAILGFVEPGELFGELALASNEPREERAEAALDSTVVLIPREPLVQLMERSAPLTMGITKLIGFRRRRVERRLKSLLFRSNRDRLMSLLLDLVEQYGRKTSEGVLVDIKLSHQELACVIGSTRETVTTLLGQLQLERILKVSRQRIVVRDLDRLAAEQQVPVPRLADASSPALAAPEFRPTDAGIAQVD